jgi:iron complex outermembrane receptor protein
MTARDLGLLSVAVFLAAPPAAAQSTDADSAALLPTVVVSARKRDESLIEVPVSITTFSARNLDDYAIRSFADYATKVPGLSFAYGNGSSPGETGTGIANARTMAIRGVAGQRTTGYYLDDTPLPVALDVRILDLQGIEVLRGPQGTLFGESSLGGNVRLLANAPQFKDNTWRLALEAGHTHNAGSGNAGATAVGNIVLMPERAALRLVVFGERQGGYLRRDYRSELQEPASPRIVVDDQAALRNGGVSATALLRVAPALALTLRLMHQYQHYQGMPAAYAPLPAFQVVPLISHTANIQPEASDNWTLPALSLAYQGQGWKLSSSTSYFMRHTLDVEDSTEGSIQYLDSYGLGTTPTQAFSWRATRRYRQLTHETRVAFDPVAGWSGIAGVYFARRRNLRDTPPVFGQDVFNTPGPTMLWTYQNFYQQEDKSVFGELYYKVLPHTTLTLGLRHYWLEQLNDGGFDGALYGIPVHSRNASQDSGNSPKLALSYQPSSQAMVYASAAKGFRAGGTQLDLSPLLGGCVTAEQASRLAAIQPDSVWSYEVGGKFDLPTPGLLVTGALYQIDWNNIQQPAFVPACAFYLNGNAGGARIRGGELEITGRLARGLNVRMGVGYEDARITEQGSSQQKVGERIRQIPKLSATLGAIYTAPLRPGLHGFVGGDWSHVGNSVSSNSVTQPLLRPGYRLLNLRTGLAWRRSELSMEVRNAADARPNLGDLGYLGYLRYDAAGQPLPQVATLPPRTVTLRYQVSF